MRMLRHRLGSLAVGLAVAIGVVTSVAGSAVADPANTTQAAAASLPISKEAHGVRNNCAINVYATAQSGASGGVQITTNADIHNPNWFVGCEVPVTIVVRDFNGVEVAARTHVAWAGARFDPRGPDQTFLWIDEVNVNPNRVGSLEIRM